MTITAYPAIAAEAEARGLIQCYALWLALRSADARRGGRGLFERSALWNAVQSAVTAASASALFSAQEHCAGDVMSRMIAQGDGVFWRATRTHVALISRRRVAMAWGIPARDNALSASHANALPIVPDSTCSNLFIAPATRRRKQTMLKKLERVRARTRPPRRYRPPKAANFRLALPASISRSNTTENKAAADGIRRMESALTFTPNVR